MGSTQQIRSWRLGWRLGWHQLFHVHWQIVSCWFLSQKKSSVSLQYNHNWVNKCSCDKAALLNFTKRANTPQSCNTGHPKIPRFSLCYLFIACFYTTHTLLKIMLMPRTWIPQLIFKQSISIKRDCVKYLVLIGFNILHFFQTGKFYLI